jgi:hypothetical protein
MPTTWLFVFLVEEDEGGAKPKLSKKELKKMKKRVGYRKLLSLLILCLCYTKADTS